MFLIKQTSIKMFDSIWSFDSSSIKLFNHKHNKIDSFSINSFRRRYKQLVTFSRDFWNMKILMNDKYLFMNNVQSSSELRNDIKIFHFHQNEFRHRLFKKIYDFMLIYDEIYKVNFADFTKLNDFCFFIIAEKSIFKRTNKNDAWKRKLIVKSNKNHYQKSKRYEKY